MAKFAAAVKKHGGLLSSAEAVSRAPAGLFAINNEEEVSLKASPVVRLDKAKASNGQSGATSHALSFPSVSSSPRASTAAVTRASARRSTFKRQTLKTPGAIATTGHNGSGSEEGSPPGSARRVANEGGKADPFNQFLLDHPHRSEDFHKMHERLLQQSAYMTELVNGCYGQKELQQAMKKSNHAFGSVWTYREGDAMDSEEAHDEIDEPHSDGDNVEEEKELTIEEDGLHAVVKDGKERIDNLFAQFACHKREEILKDTAAWLKQRQPHARRDHEILEEYEATIEDRHGDIEQDTSDLATLVHMQGFYEKLEDMVRGHNIFEKDLQELHEAREHYQQVHAESQENDRLIAIKNQVKELREELLSLDTKMDIDADADNKKYMLDQLANEVQNRSHDVELAVDLRRKAQATHKTCRLARKEMSFFTSSATVTDFLEKLSPEVHEKVNAIVTRLFDEESFKLVLHYPELEKLKAKIKSYEAKTSELDAIAADLEVKEADMRSELMKSLVLDDDPAFLNELTTEEFSLQLDEELQHVQQECLDLERTTFCLKENLRNMRASISQMEDAREAWRENLNTAAANLLIYSSYPEADNQARAHVVELPAEGRPSMAWHQQLDTSWRAASRDMEYYKAFAEHYPEAQDAEALASELDASKVFAWTHIDAIWDILNPGSNSDSPETLRASLKDAQQRSEAQTMDIQALRQLEGETERLASLALQLETSVGKAEQKDRDGLQELRKFDLHAGLQGALNKVMAKGKSQTPRKSAVGSTEDAVRRKSAAATSKTPKDEESHERWEEALKKAQDKVGKLCFGDEDQGQKKKTIFGLKNAALVSAVHHHRPSTPGHTISTDVSDSAGTHSRKASKTNPHHGTETVMSPSIQLQEAVSEANAFPSASPRASVAHLSPRSSEVYHGASPRPSDLLLFQRASTADQASPSHYSGILNHLSPRSTLAPSPRGSEVHQDVNHLSPRATIAPSPRHSEVHQDPGRWLGGEVPLELASPIGHAATTASSKPPPESPLTRLTNFVDRKSKAAIPNPNAKSSSRPPRNTIVEEIEPAPLPAAFNIQP